MAKLSNGKKRRLADKSRENRRWKPNNGLTTNGRDFSEVGEWGVLNPRRHQEIQRLAKKNSKPRMRTILIQNRKLDNGIS